MKIFSAARIVLKQERYAVLALATAALAAFLFSISSSLIQIYPAFFINYSRLTFEYAIFLTVFSVLISLNFTFYTFILRTLKEPAKTGGRFLASGLGSSFVIPACAECVPLVLSVLGVSFGTWSAVFQPFIVEIQILTIILLIISLGISSSHICLKCKKR